MRLLTLLLCGLLACTADRVDGPAIPNTAYAVAPAVQDSGFEQGGGAWAKSSLSGRSVVTSTAHLGTHSQQIIAPTTVGARNVYQGLPATGNTLYTTGSWMRVNSIAVQATTKIFWYNQVVNSDPSIPVPVGALIRVDTIGALAGTLNAWVGRTNTVLSPTNTVWMRVDLSVYTINGTGTGWFDDIAVSSDSVPPDTTTPPDTTVAFTQFKARYLGGSAREQLRDLVVDGQGNLYAVGGTASDNFPVTAGVFDPTHNNTYNGTVQPYDVFITKFDSSGNLVASTFLGGAGYDRAYAVELAPDGDVVVAGRTGGGLPNTAGTFAPTFAGGTTSSAYGPQDPFVCKVASDLTAVRWCTYGGGSAQDFYRDVDVDQSGVIWAAGTNASTNLPAAWFTGSVQPVRATSGDEGTVYKISSTGQLLAATWVGGNGNADGIGPSIRSASDGTVWLAVGTNSSNLPTNRKSYAGSSDTYLVHLSADLKTRQYATYIGGSSSDAGETHNLAINYATGDVYVAAQSSSVNFEITPDAVQATMNGINDAFIQRYTSSGGLLTSTRFGGSAGDGFQGVLVGQNGYVYATGWNGSDAIAVVFTAALQPIYTKAWGGPTGDMARCVGVLAGDVFWVGGQSTGGFPITYGPAYAGSDDGFIVRVR